MISLLPHPLFKVGRRKQSIEDQMEDIECLTHLFKTCGRLLDHAKAKTRMDQYFERIRAIINNPKMPTRIKFLLQDVIEMRTNRWMPRKLATPDGPRTIQQVRQRFSFNFNITIMSLV